MKAGSGSADGRFLALDPDKASDEQLRELYDFLARAAAHDRVELELERESDGRESGEPDPDRFDEFVASLFRRSSPKTSGSVNFLLVRSGGGIVASVAYSLGGGVDRDVAMVGVTVDPQRRGEGIGTAVLRASVLVVRATGRKRIRAVVLSGDSEKWAWNAGFRPVARRASQCLVVADADPRLWADVPVPVGYRLKSWDDATPEEFLESYARARQAFQELAHSGFAAGNSNWTPEQVRQDEADSAAKNVECRVVVAVHEATGEIVGMTETGIFHAKPQIVDQAYTAVVRQHQGHGLGGVMKAAMMRRLLAERPGIVEVRTDALGEHAARMNRGLGYRTVAERVLVEATVDQLERTFNAVS